jgi:hypothetical protein
MRARSPALLGKMVRPTGGCQAGPSRKPPSSPPRAQVLKNAAPLLMTLIEAAAAPAQATGWPAMQALLVAAPTPR